LRVPGGAPADPRRGARRRRARLRARGGRGRHRVARRRRRHGGGTADTDRRGPRRRPRARRVGRALRTARTDAPTGRGAARSVLMAGDLQRDPAALTALLQCSNAARRTGAPDAAAESAVETAFAASRRLAVYGTLVPGGSNHHLV